MPLKNLVKTGGVR
jgi:hypothetical protein